MQFDPTKFTTHSFPQELTISRSGGTINLDSRAVTKYGIGAKYKFARLMSDGSGTVAVELLEAKPESEGSDEVPYEFVTHSPRGTGATVARLQISKFSASLDYSPRQKYRAPYTIESNDGRMFLVFTLPRFGVDKASTRTAAELAEAAQQDDDAFAALSDKDLDLEIRDYFGARANVKFDEALTFICNLDKTVTPERLKKRMLAVGVRDLAGGFWKLAKEVKK